MKDLGIRFISGLIGLILLIIIASKGGIILASSIFIISIIGIREFYKALRNINIIPIEAIGYIGTILLFLSAIFPVLSLDLIVTSIIIMMILVILIKKNIDLGGIALTLFGIFYIPFLLFHIYYLDGTDYLWLVFIVAFGTDTFAYGIGNLLGKHKLSPTLSPKKTVEGAIGGIFGSVILTLSYSIYMELGHIWQLLVLSIVVSAMSQMGELFGSKIKRISGIKDYGFIMPGHGGVLDRFDSIIVCAPLIYYYVYYFIN